MHSFTTGLPSALLLAGGALAAPLAFSLNKRGFEHQTILVGSKVQSSAQVGFIGLYTVDWANDCFHAASGDIDATVPAGYKIRPSDVYGMSDCLLIPGPDEKMATLTCPSRNVQAHCVVKDEPDLPVDSCVYQSGTSKYKDFFPKLTCQW